jgi:hypothetical protein
MAALRLGEAARGRTLENQARTPARLETENELSVAIPKALPGVNSERKFLRLSAQVFNGTTPRRRVGSYPLGIAEITRRIARGFSSV